MTYSPILLVHICCGTLGLLSGTAAMCFRKGSSRHVLAGKVFVASMLTMAVTAAYIAIVRHQPNNIGGGILTFYLIGTAWLTAKRRDGETSRFDWVALLLLFAIGILGWMNGLDALHSPTGEKYGVPAGMHLLKHLSPALFSTGLYLVLSILPLILLIFWLVRVRFTDTYKGKSIQLASTSPD